LPQLDGLWRLRHNTAKFSAISAGTAAIAIATIGLFGPKKAARD